MTAPTTRAGKAYVKGTIIGKGGVAAAIAAIEAEARRPYEEAIAAIPSRDSIVRQERERIAAAVEAMIAERGGRCVKPADFEPDSLNVCEAHSELIFDDGCEDQPRELLAVLAIIRGEA